MTRVFRQEDGSYLIPVELPEADSGNGDYVNDRHELLKLAKIKGYRVDFVKWGYRIFLAVLVPGTEEEFRAYIGEEDRRQKAQRADGRCPVPDGRGGIIRCPERLPNPEYGSKSNAPKTVKNDCGQCVYNTFGKPDYSTAVFSQLEERDEDGEGMPFEIEADMAQETWKYDEARREILKMVREKYPGRYEDIRLRLEGYTRSEVAEKLGMGKSTAYKLGLGLTRDLLELLDSLWYLDIEKYMNQ